MTSVCPGDTGKSSGTASAWVLPSMTRSTGSRQKGQSLGLESLIVALDALLTDSPNLLQVFSLKLPPQLRGKADVGQVAVVAQETPSLECLKWLAQHQPLRGHVVQLVDGLPAGARTLDDKARRPALLVEPPEPLHHVAQLRFPVVSNRIQEGQQHHRLVRQCHVHVADELQESIADR